MAFNAKISTSATKSDTTTKQDSWSVEKTVIVPSMTSVEMIWSIGEQTLDIDFTADISISGIVYARGLSSTKTYEAYSTFSTFFENLKSFGIPFPNADNVKYVGPDKKDVQFTLQGTISGHSAIESGFQAIEHPLRPRGQRLQSS